MLQYVVLHAAAVWSPAVTAECSVKVLKAGGAQDIYPEACLPAVSPFIYAMSNILPCGTHRCSCMSSAS